MMEASIQSGAARYRQASRQAMAARETEIAAFRAINRALDSADSEEARIRALGRNHDLWSMLVKDIGLGENKLPEALKNNLLALGLWAMNYSTLAILHKLSPDPLIGVNRNIAEGLSMQMADTAMPQNGAKTAPATA
jgi:flagellar protein FlaF